MDEPCLEVPRCDGVTSECPFDVFKADNTPCTMTSSGANGVCVGGKCGHPHDAFCKDQSSELLGCTVPGNECTRTCRRGDTVGCVAFDAACRLVNPDTDMIEWWSDGSPGG